jgi:nicotinate-nucleotide pyrophosphorylase (carboxylating)
MLLSILQKSMDTSILSKLLKATLEDIPACVARALKEDVGSGDVTAMLIPEQQKSKAEVICRENAVICGCAWVEEVFKQLDPSTIIHWLVKDGDEVEPNQPIFTVSGNTRVLLTGERTALNFLQLLTGTATMANRFAHLTKNTNIKILDTRKTIPGLRLAQKYAVAVGGCDNHRVGLYDAFLIKENHITASGGITLAVSKAREIAPDKIIEVEVENLTELNEALDANADAVMVDNFTKEELEALKNINFGNTKIEVSGNITEESIKAYTEYAVNYISSGSLTKHIHAVDLSMRLIN